MNVNLSDAFYAIYAMDEFLANTPKSDYMYPKIEEANKNITSEMNKLFGEIKQTLKEQD